MKKIKLQFCLLLMCAAFLGSCNATKGSANDRTGTNGATNGNGKVINN